MYTVYIAYALSASGFSTLPFPFDFAYENKKRYFIYPYPYAIDFCCSLCVYVAIFIALFESLSHIAARYTQHHSNIYYNENAYTVDVEEKCEIKKKMKIVVNLL